MKKEQGQDTIKELMGYLLPEGTLEYFDLMLIGKDKAVSFTFRAFLHVILISEMKSFFSARADSSPICPFAPNIVCIPTYPLRVSKAPPSGIAIF